MNNSLSLRIATRIHFALLRQYGANVEVGTLLKGGADAREAMWVCEASGDAELVALARQLKDLLREATGAAADKGSGGGQNGKQAGKQIGKQAAPQDAAWSQDTSGFGLSRPPELGLPPVAENSRWLHPSSWGRRNAAAPRH